MGTEAYVNHRRGLYQPVVTFLCFKQLPYYWKAAAMIKEKGIRSARGFFNKARISLPASDAPSAVVLSFPSGPGGGRER